MSFLRKLFGGGGDKAPAPPRVAAEEDHEGFHIAAAPVAEGGQFRVAATISKEIGGEMRSHHLVRADMLQSEDEAAQMSLRKAKQVIDERGDALFGA